MLTIRRRPDSVVTLRTIVPTDSVVIQRNSNIVFLSARDAMAHLQAELMQYPHIRSDSALLGAIQAGVAANGWVRLPTADDRAVERQNFLMVALLLQGRAAVRQGTTGTLAAEVRIVFWGSCAMANGKGVLLPDSTELFRTLDGWHSCFDA